MESKNFLIPEKRKEHKKIPARTPSERQKLAVMLLGENGGNKRKAALDAGYSQKMADNPKRIFGSEGVQELMASIGVTPQSVLKVIERHTKARKPVHMVFPTYDPEKALEWQKQSEIDLVDRSLKIRKSQMTDEDLRLFIEGNNGVVFRITHSETARHVYYWHDDAKAQLKAAEMFKDMLGLDAPKKVDLKGQVNHTFSLSGLRQNMERNGYEIIKPREIPASDVKVIE
ncbi:hypothetical protein A2Z56_02465 [Candidatus Kaiserbacteria bacterium RIFCSPHIGHO2_12_45_16]|nr:MAG: hypothetical protein A2Z56_02465 [Candidatus Kaiserbacteria bacterium RIFCSPHIGHO2_12_45_16]